MTIEVVASEIGVLGTLDLQLVPAEQEQALVVVVSAVGPPFIGRVGIGFMSGGRGQHRGWTCPTCALAMYKLFVGKTGELACRACGRRRYRQQLEKSTRRWYYLGGRLEEDVLRGVQAARGSPPPAHLFEAVDRLIAGDLERWNELSERAEHALRLAQLPQSPQFGDVSDVNQAEDGR